MRTRTTLPPSKASSFTPQPRHDSGVSTRRLTDSWVFKSLAINAVGALLDYAVALTLVTGLAVMTPLATAAGVCTGACFNFLMNRSVAFRDGTPSAMSRQALRFIGAMGTLMVIHSMAVWFLRDGMGVPFIPAKLACDVVLLGATQPFVLRYFVFPRGEAEQKAALDYARADRLG